VSRRLPAHIRRAKYLEKNGEPKQNKQAAGGAAKRVSGGSQRGGV